MRIEDKKTNEIIKPNTKTKRISLKQVTPILAR